MLDGSIDVLDGKLVKLGRLDRRIEFEEKKAYAWTQTVRR